MNATYMTVPLIFLIDSLFSLYILAVVLRFLLQSVKADFYNPIFQTLVTATHPPLKLLRRFLPSIGKIDTSSIVLALLLQMLTNVSILLLQGVKTTFVTLLIFSCSHLIELTLNIFIFAILTQAILTWFSPDNYNPATLLLAKLTAPLLEGCRKIIPDLGALDFSPLAALLLLQLAKMLLLPPLEKLAYMLG
jgi:YggT family protein